MPSMCKRHPDKPAIIRTDGFSTGRCRECMDANVRKARAARSKKKRGELPRVRRKKENENVLLQLDFQSYPDLLEKLKALAQEEFRPLEMEILFLLQVQTQAEPEKQ